MRTVINTTLISTRISSQTIPFVEHSELHYYSFELNINQIRTNFEILNVRGIFKYEAAIFKWKQTNKILIKTNELLRIEMDFLNQNLEKCMYQCKSMNELNAPIKVKRNFSIQ